MKKGLVLVVMCVAMLFAAAPSASAQAPSDEYKAGTIRFYGVGKGYGATDDFYVETTIIGIGFFLGWLSEEMGRKVWQ